MQGPSGQSAAQTSQLIPGKDTDWRDTNGRDTDGKDTREEKNVDEN